MGKILYSEVCLRKLNWDEEAPEDIFKPWAKWLNDMKKCLYVSVPRSVVGTGLTKVILHGFADASKLPFSVAVFPLAIHTSAPVQRNLLVGKSRIAPREKSIPRLDLVAAHTLSRLMHHVKEVLKDQCVEVYHCWVDSTTVLNWIKGLCVTEPRLFRTRSTYSGIMFQPVTTLVFKEAVASYLAKWGSCGFEGLSGLVLETNGQINLKCPGAQKVSRKG